MLLFIGNIGDFYMKITKTYLKQIIKEEKEKLDKENLEEAGLTAHATFWAINNPTVALAVIGTFGAFGLRQIGKDVKGLFKSFKQKKDAEKEKKILQLGRAIDQIILKEIETDPKLSNLKKIYDDAKVAYSQRVSKVTADDDRMASIMTGPSPYQPTELENAAKQINAELQQKHPEAFKRIQDLAKQQLQNI